MLCALRLNAESMGAMRVAVTVWEGRVSPVFDVCREALILTITDKTVVSTTTVAMDADNPNHKISQLVDLQVQTLICGAISQPLHHELDHRGIRVIGFVAGETDQVVEAFLANELPGPRLSMPGCGCMQNRFRGGQGTRRYRRRYGR